MDAATSDQAIEKKELERLMEKLENGSEEEKIHKDSKSYRFIQKIWYFFVRQTSPVHRQDAKEKYWILWRELEAAMYEKALDLKYFSFRGFKEKSSEEIDEQFKDFLRFFLKHLIKNQADFDSAKTFGNLFLYARILSKQNLKMLNKAEALNMMWRDITFVRSRLLTDGVIPDERLPAHLEYCRLECTKICPGKEAGLEEMCHRTALELVDSEESNSTAKEANSEKIAKNEKNRKARRTIALILAKLNHIRLSDINAQLRLKKIYNVAFILLVLLSYLLLHLNERLTNQFVPYWVAWDKFRETFEFSAPYSWVTAPVDFAVFMLQNNLLFFIFFAGLLGGFFSTVMRLRSKEVNIGDVYLRSYLLTKPIVGALGATILFIIIKSNILSIDLGQIQIIDKISMNSSMFGPIGFAFGFIMGFSERIILPSVKSESAQ